MERKFKLKLVPVKASEVRKQAIVHLKETIELNKFKQIDPVDYDLYVEQNLVNLRKDICTKQLVFLPADDLNAKSNQEDDDLEKKLIENSFRNKSEDISLFVNDCLSIYFNHKYEIKYKQHLYGGNYRQLPNFSEITIENSMLVLPELSYEIDAENSIKNLNNKNPQTSSLLNINGRNGQLNNDILFEKNGWLNHKIVSNLKDNQKNLKKRYFQLKLVEAASIRGLILEPRYRPLNNENQQDENHRKVYILDCYKEIPQAANLKQNPKYRIIFDYNIKELNNVSNKNGSPSYSFELSEISVESSKNIKHLFVADCQKTFDDWYSTIEKLISLNKNSRINNINKSDMVLINEKFLSPITSLNSGSLNLSGSSNSATSSSCTSSVSDASSSPKSSENSSSEASGRNSHLIEEFKLTNNQQLIDNFDLDKYLNENDEDLLGNKMNNNDLKISHDQLNIFDLYPRMENDELIDEETELESVWPEPSVGRKLLLEFDSFKLNLCYPIISHDIKQKTGSFRANNNNSYINPEIFYLIFAIYDAKNNQKISENYYHIPNYDLFFNQLIASSSNSSSISKEHTITNNNSQRNSICNLKNSKNSIFSLDGRNLLEDFSTNNNSLIKLNFLNKIKKALFTIPEVHEDIFLVVRIEKCLDGTSINASLQPYLTPLNESNKIKTAIKVNKKMQQLLRTKLANYRQPFAWAAKPIYKKILIKQTNMISYELDNQTRFTIYEQDVQTLNDENLFKYLNDYRTKDRYLYKLNEISGNIKLYINDFPSDVIENKGSFINKTNLISSSYILKNDHSSLNSNDFILNIDYFDTILPNYSLNDSTNQYSPIRIATTTAATTNNNDNNNNNNSIEIQNNTQNSKIITTDHLNLIKKSKQIKTNDSFRSYLYVYPKSLKYDQQKVFSKARNILVKTELREKDSNCNDESAALNCIFNMNKNFFTNNEEQVFTTNHSTLITHHNKNPCFYDEIKILLPINLNEKHHLLFKFYHVSCSNAKNSSLFKNEDSATITLTSAQNDSSSVNSNNNTNINAQNVKSTETLIGYAWLPIFKNGRLINGEKHLPIAQSLSSDYLSFENIGLGQSIGPADIKWLDSMKNLFKISLVPLSTIHTTDPHVANFYNQSEKIVSLLKINGMKTVPNSIGKKKAPLISGVNNSSQLNTIIENKPVVPNKEIINNSIKTELTVWSKPSKEELSLSYILKGLHATEIYTIIKFLPSLLSRILKTLITTVSSDVSIHSVRALLHFVWQATSIGKIDVLKSFIKYIFYIDYSYIFNNNDLTLIFPTVHNELILNLVVLIKQILPIQDLCQMNRLYKNCWFCLEITLKSLCLYTIQFKKMKSNDLKPLIFEETFYESLRSLYELLIESIIKYGSMVSTATKDTEFINSYKSCNRSLAMFLKKSLNILNRKFIFQLINKYLENFHLCDKNLIEIKFDFIRIICNHEHYIAFNLPIKKAVSNINEFTDMKHEFVLSDQFRQFHFLVGVILSQFCISLNENKEQRKLAICILRNILCKHTYDNRYNDDRNKQARIASLYLPIIDVLIENLDRINTNLINPASIKSASTNNDIPRNSSSITSQTVSTGTTHNSNGTSSSTSLLNEAANQEASSKPINETSSVLGAIAGLAGNAAKLQNHLENIICPVSDTDSLSSADNETQFKHHLTKRSSSLITGSINNSDNITLNNSNSINVSNVLALSANNGGSCTEQVAKSFCMIRKDKLESNEIKDLLICVVIVLKNISHDSLLGLLLNYDDNEFVDFLTLLELSLKTFKYRGKSQIQTLNAISKSKDIKSMIRSPPRLASNIDILEKIGNSFISSKITSNEQQLDEHLTSEIMSDSISNNFKHLVLLESNMSHQVSLVVMNILSLVLIHQKEKLIENHGDNPIAKRLIEIYFYLLQSNQSEQIKLKTFLALRLLINKMPTIFLDGNSTLCASLCLRLLKCFNSKFQSIRVESCIALYLLMRKNYEHSKQKSIARVHSQTIISLSQLIGTMKLSTSIEVLDCLLILNTLASNDKQFQNTRFALEVDDLTKRIRNIFMATSQMKTFEDDSEMLIDSQYCLAKSYANCLELRRTWLDSMASIHIKEKNYAESAYCYLHIAALVAENLKHQGMYTLGCSVFKKITPNIELEEELNSNNNSTMKSCDSYNDLNEVQYTQTQLLDYLCKSADMLKLAERYDSLPNIFKFAVAIYETNRDYEHLQQMHQNIQRAYSYMAERDQRASEKPLGAYYRISFYGKMFNDENDKVYIYKEPGNTKLFEICDRLRKVYGKRFGSMDSVEILRDNRKPTELKLDTNNKNYIQVTSVQPYFDANDLAERINFFDKNNNLKKFYYETSYQLKEFEQTNDENKTPQTVATPQHIELLRLCKRKIILETSHWFPYVKKRILVIYEKPIDLNPLETAIDEIKQKIDSFETILRKKDLTLLELYLQGGIIPQVHKGPLAYAEAFLDPNEMNKQYSKELKKEFKTTFKRLIDSYQKGIEMYGQLANKLITGTDENSSTNRLSLNVSNLINTTLTSTQQTAAKYLDMYRLLQEKFNEVENSFRNLLLIDGDFDLYQQQLKVHSQTSRTQVLTDINNSSIMTSSNA